MEMFHPLFCFRVLGLVAFLERTDLVDGTTHARHFLSREFIRALFLKHLSEHPRYERVRKTLSDKGYTNSLDSHEHNWVSMYPRVPQERRRKNRGGVARVFDEAFIGFPLNVSVPDRNFALTYDTNVGFGLKATKSIPADQAVTFYDGFVLPHLRITASTVPPRVDILREFGHFSHLHHHSGEDTTIQGGFLTSSSAGAASFLNSSRGFSLCDANLTEHAVKVTTRQGAPSFLHYYTANRDIKVNEPLTYDYEWRQYQRTPICTLFDEWSPGWRDAFPRVAERLSPAASSASPMVTASSSSSSSSAMATVT